MLQNLEKITYGKKTICEAGLILGTRRWGWELKRTCRPLWAKSERIGGYVSLMNYRKGNIQLFIPRESLKAGDDLFIMDAGTARTIHINAVCDTAIDFEELPAQVKPRRDYKKQAANDAIDNQADIEYLVKRGFDRSGCMAATPKKLHKVAQEERELEPLTLTDSGELSNPLDSELPALDLDALERAEKIHQLNSNGFNLNALLDLNETELESLYCEYGGGQ